MCRSNLFKSRKFHRVQPYPYPYFLRIVLQNLKYLNRNQTTRISTKAPKTKRWTVRLIDTIAAFLAINARTSFSIQNDAEIKSYSQLDFYKDLLKEKYPKILTISKISIVAKKPNFEFKKRCNWTKPSNCKKSTKTPCMNQVCEKMACLSHSITICFDCTQLTDLTKKSILINFGRSDKRELCHFLNCRSRGLKQCAILECKKHICGIHEFKLCHDCISSVHSTNMCLSRKMNDKKS